MSFLFQIRTEQAHHSHPVHIDQAGQTSQPNFQSGEQNAGYATISNDGVGKYVKRAELLIKSQISYYPNPSGLFRDNATLRDFFQTAYGVVCRAAE